MKKGDLAFIPSAATLKQFKKGTTALHKYHILTKPSSAVVLGAMDNCYEVLFEGESWVVDQNSLYPMTRSENGNGQIDRSI